jgi:hypothetical protein
MNVRNKNSIQILRKRRTGSMIIEKINSSTPPTAMPIMRKGSNINHTSGYKTIARSATGQHKTNNMHHNRNFTMARLFFA